MAAKHYNKNSNEGRGFLFVVDTGTTLICYERKGSNIRVNSVNMFEGKIKPDKKSYEPAGIELVNDVLSAAESQLRKLKIDVR